MEVKDPLNKKKKTLIIILLVIVLLGGVIISWMLLRKPVPEVPSQTPSVPVVDVGPQNLDEAKQKLVVRNNKFGFDLYQRLPERQAGNQNLVFSPYSISTAFGMVYEGADGQTAKEIASVFGNATADDLRHHAFKNQYDDLTADGKFQIANSIWVRQDYCPPKESFQDTIVQVYKGEAASVDFNSLETNKRINKWVDDKTNHKINSILSEDQPLGPLTKVVLVNAIHFKADWLARFEAEDTHKRDFTCSDGSKVEADMMPKSFKNIDYTENDVMQLIKLPYKDSSFEFVAILPKDKNMSRLEEQLNNENLQKWLSEVESNKVDVILPKFKINYHPDGLVKHLKDLGVKEAFSGEANFEKLNPEQCPKPFISDVEHKAMIEVDEKGTEAAAVTAIVMKDIAMVEEEPSKKFIADHPFVFMIIDEDSQQMMFLGKLANPAA